MANQSITGGAFVSKEQMKLEDEENARRNLARVERQIAEGMLSAAQIEEWRREHPDPNALDEIEGAEPDAEQNESEGAALSAASDEQPKPKRSKRRKNKK